MVSLPMSCTASSENYNSCSFWLEGF